MRCGGGKLSEAQKTNTDKREHSGLRNLGNLGRAAQVGSTLKAPGTRVGSTLGATGGQPVFYIDRI